MDVKRDIKRFLRRTLGSGLVAGCIVFLAFGHEDEGRHEEKRHGDILRIDHAVPHI